MTKSTHTHKYESYIRLVHENFYLYTWRVIIDHIENVDKTQEDCDQETHTAGNNLEIFFGQNRQKDAYLRWNNEWCPWDNNEEAWRQIINNEVFGVMARNFYVEACQREIPELTVIVQK